MTQAEYQQKTLKNLIANLKAQLNLKTKSNINRWLCLSNP